MSTVFGASNAASSLLNSSYQNITAKTLIVNADKTYSVAPGQVLTLSSAAAHASVDITNAISNGQLRSLSVFSAINNPVVVNGVLVSGEGPVAGAPTVNVAGNGLVSTPGIDSTGHPTITLSLAPHVQNQALGGFSGISATADGYWLLQDGNRLIYPNSQGYSQPAPGNTSIINFGAIMRRTDTSAGSLGFAVYTDAAITDSNFANGYLIHYGINGQAVVYKVVNYVLIPLASTLNLSYPVDTNWNNYNVVVSQPLAGQLIFSVYFGGTPILRAIDQVGADINGTVGFSTAQGSLPCYVQPDSFNFSIGVGAHETQSLGTQAVVSAAGQFNATLAQPGTTLPQINTDPAVVWGAATGSSKNLIPDSGYKWGGVFWDYGYAGPMHVLSGLGINGGNATVYSAPAGAPQASGTLFYKQVVATPVQANTQYTFSASIDGSAVVSGGPSWAVWSPDLTVKLTELTQVPGSSALMYKTFVTPASGITSVVAVGATNNCVVQGGANLVFSGEQLEIGTYRTAYQESIVDDITKFIPYGMVPPSIKNVITQTPAGSGQLNINTAVPGQTLNYSNNSDAVTNTINQNVNGSSGSNLVTNAVSNQQVQGQSITTNQVLTLRYSTNTYNVYSDPGVSVPGSSGLWWLKGVGPLTSSTTIPNNSTIIYQTGVTDPSSAPSQLDSLQLAANSTINVLWQHSPYAASSLGSTTINFAGTATGAYSNNITTGTVSGNSSPSITTQVVNTNVNQLFSGGVSNSSSTQISAATALLVTPTIFSGTIANAATATITNTGAVTPGSQNSNNTSNTSITSNTTYNSAVTATSYSATPTLTTNYTISPASTGINNTMATSINKVTTFPQATNSITNNSTATITSSVLSNTTVNPASANISNSSNPSITSSTSSSTAPQVFNSTTQTPSSTATITRTANPTTYQNTPTTGAAANTSLATSITRGNPTAYVNTAGNGPDSGGGNASYGTITTYISYVTDTGSTVNISIPMYQYQKTDEGDDGSGQPTGYSWVDAQVANANIGYTDIQTSPNAVADGIRGITLNFNLPALANGTNGNTTYYSYVTGPRGTPAKTTTQAKTTPFTTPIAWNVYLIDPSGTTVGSYLGQSGPSYITYYGTDSSGTYTFRCYPYFTTDNGIAATPDTVGATGSVYTTTQHAQTNYQGNGGPGANITTTPSNMVGPTPSTPFRIHVNNVVNTTNANGSSQVNIYVEPPDPTYNQTWYNVSSNSDINITTGPGGAWRINYFGSMNTVNNTGIGTFPCNVDIVPYYYLSNPSAYSYTTSSSANTAVAATTSAALAPSSSTPITFNLSNIVLQSDGTGSNSFIATVQDPNNAVVLTQTISSTANVTITVPTSSTAGIYTLYLQAVPTVTSTTANSSSYTCSATVTPSWYILTTNPTTYTYTDSSGASVPTISSASTLSPTTSTPISIAVSNLNVPSDSLGSSALKIDLYNPAGTLVTSYTTTTNKTFTYSGGGAAGVWTWSSYAIIASDNHTNVSSYPVTYSIAASYYQNVTTTITNYSNVPGTAATYKTGNDTVAPTTTSNQLSFAIPTISVGTASYGTSNYVIQLLNPSSTVVKTWTITTAQTLTYSASAAVGGAYTWNVVSNAVPNNTGTGSFTNTLSGYIGWYHNVTTNTTVYNANPGTSTNYATGTTNALAPTGAGTQVSFNATAVFCPTDAQGTSSYTITLADPSGNPLSFSSSAGGGASTSKSFTTPTNFFYSNASAPVGAYTWTVQAVTTNNNINTDTFPCNLSATVGWYITSVNYVPSSATAINYTTTSNALGGTSAQPITLSITSLTLPSNANGSNSYTVSLFGPASAITPIQTWANITAAQSLSYTGGGAQGTYTFAIQAVVAPTNTAADSYSNSLTATMGYYTSTPTGSYAPHVGPIVNYVTGNATAPTVAGRQLSFSITSISVTSDANGSSNFTVTLTDPSNNVVLTRNGLTSNQTITYSASGAPAGIYTWSAQALLVNNQSGPGSYPATMSSTVGWYVPQVNYTAVNGSVQSFTTPGITAPPVNAGTQLTYNISDISTPSDPNGTTSYNITLLNPSGTSILTRSGITAATTITYSDPAAPGGVYTWNIQAIVIANNNGIGTYPTRITATYTFYNSNFQSNNPSPSTYLTSASATLAPTSASSQVSFNITSATLPSDGSGSTSYVATLFNPNNISIRTWTITSASSASYTYFDPAAPAGLYTISLQPQVANNAAGTGTYPMALNGNLTWYQNVTSTITNYTAIPGDSTAGNANFYTDPTTTAPNSVATEISLNIASITAVANSYGTPTYTVVLKSPNHTQLRSWTNVHVGDAIFYYDVAGNATPGSYQWVIYPTNTPTNTGTSTYTTALNGTIYWYQPVVNTTYNYIPKDGSATTYRSPSNTTAPTSGATQLALSLSSVNTPTHAYGNTSLKITLADPNNNIVQSWPTTGQPAITNLTSNTFTYSGSAATSGSYTWSVYGTVVPSASSGNISFVDSWSGSQSWYQPSSVSTGIYITASDGTTSRISCSDSDVNFTRIDNTSARFQVSNTSGSTLNFQLGVSSVGI